MIPSIVTKRTISPTVIFSSYFTTADADTSRENGREAVSLHAQPTLAENGTARIVVCCKRGSLSYMMVKVAGAAGV
jgi:hypothetical protein